YVVSLLTTVTENINQNGDPNPVLTQFQAVILETATFREDCELILSWTNEGFDPSDYFDKATPAGSPPLPPKPRRRALQKPPEQKSVALAIRGFPEHAKRERELTAQLAERSISRASFSGKPPFVEVPGAVELFSVHEAEKIYTTADSLFGSDNHRYVEKRISDLMILGNRRGLATAPSIEQIKDLRVHFPNAGEVLDMIERAAALSRLSPSNFFALSPLLILGDPGVGKSAFLQALAKCLSAPFQRIDIATLSTGCQLFGTSLTWGTGRTGEIFNLLANSPVLNPLIFLDEIEKAHGNYYSPILPALLSLLEPETSKAFRDEAIPLSLNAQHVLWVAAANELDEMSAPLLSRFNVVRIYRPEGEAAVTVAGLIYQAIRQDNPWGRRFPDQLDRPVALRLARWIPREMSRLIKHAFGTAALAGRTHLIKADVPVPVVKAEHRCGFV
ncbi:MAG: AAA family ATPase, partial [Proteobacteria bacterium]|nr:AAA family ATPase [Pseudomonadota bacterium]